MAILLTVQPLRERQLFLNSEEDSSCNESVAMSGPFRATQRWNGIIKHLQDNVDLRPCKSKTKRLEGCFSGANAVDVLLPHLKQGGFERDISRDNAVKLCQLLLEQNIFDDIQAAPQVLLTNTKANFQDSPVQFYRFIRDQRSECHPSVVTVAQVESQSSRQAEKRPAQDEGSNSSPFDRKKRCRGSFISGRPSKNEQQCDENNIATTAPNVFERKKKKRASFGFGKSKGDALPGSSVRSPLTTPLDKKKRKRSSFGLGRLKTEASYNLCASAECLPPIQAAGDKRRCSFRLSKPKLDLKCMDSGSQESLSQPSGKKKTRRSFGSFRIGKKTDSKYKEIETASTTSSDISEHTSDAKSLSSGSSVQSCSDERGSVQSLASSTTGSNEHITIDVNNVWKEATIQRLLQLVDIPLLEDLLSCADGFQATSFIGGSESTKGHSHKGDWPSDPWLVAALTCLKSHPESATITSTFLDASNAQSKPSVHARKLLMYQTLKDHYAGGRRKGPALVPGELLDVLNAVTFSLGHGRTSRASELTQLFLMLLGKGGRVELGRLLEFMAAASDKKAVKLSYEMENRVDVITSFVHFIIPSDIMSPVRAKNLVSFMMDCHDCIFRVPQAVSEKARGRTARLLAGLQDISRETYCVRLSPQQYHWHRTKGTDLALRDLTNAVIDDTKIPLKDKKQHLQNMKKHHPNIYGLNFADML